MSILLAGGMVVFGFVLGVVGVLAGQVAIARALKA